MHRLDTLASHITGAPRAPAVLKTQSTVDVEQRRAIATLKELAAQHGLDIAGGHVRRTSSRFCLGVEHGDYNGTELFGVGTDRFIWLGYKARGDNRCRIVSANFPKDGVVEWTLGDVPPPGISDSWARFPHGADHVLHKAGYKLTRGFDAVVIGNIPGGGMSRSASLSINLVLTYLELNRLTPQRIPLDRNGKSYEIVELAQRIENDYIGSPSGYLDQIMIYYAKAGLGTHFIPKTQEVRYVELGCDASTFSIGALDTGTNRPGLEKSTYKIRKEECDRMAEMLAKRFPGVKQMADLNAEQYATATKEFGASHPDLCDRMRYIFEAKGRFAEMLAAWKAGDVAKVGAIFRTDGVGLRDIYKISGPELETMCDVVRAVPGVLGERMLGGGDKGASGCLVRAGSEAHVLAAVQTAYPRSRPDFADKWAVHFVKVCDGVTDLPGLL